MLATCVATARGDDRAIPPPREEFRAWAEAHCSRIETVEARDDQADLAPLAEIVGDARVVALGEAVHGADEELALRNRVIRYLVTERGFTAVGLEAGLSQSKVLYDHVLGRIEASPSEIAGAFTYGFGRYRENHELVRWLREHNGGVAPERRVRLYGFDLTGSYFDNGRRSLDAVLTYIDRADPGGAASIRAEYAETLERINTSAFLKLSPGQQDRVAAKLLDLAALVRRRRVAYVAATLSDDHDWALRQAVSAVQDISFLRNLPPGFSLATSRAGYVGWDEPMNQRDATMAENVGWILDREGPKGRLIVFAHNYHVQAGEQPRAPELAEAGDTMYGGFPFGSHLRSMLGGNLVVIGSQCGDFQGWPAGARSGAPETSAGSLKDLAGSPGLPLYLLDLRRLPASGPLRDWMWGVRAEGVFRGRRLVPAQAYDALLYHGLLTPAIEEGHRPDTDH